MCQFPSWIELEDKTIVYLTDKDLKNPCFSDCSKYDLIGHSAIEKMYTKIKGKHKEGFPCHPEIVQAIKDGKMKKMMRLDGVAKIKLDDRGRLNSITEPVVELIDGTKVWYKNNNRHREDGPAVESPERNNSWWLNGQLHRTDGPAIEYKDGTKKWYLNGRLHRTDGPAREYTNGTKEWYVNGQLHNANGPAVIYYDGRNEWHLEGDWVSRAEFRKLRHKYINANTKGK